MEKIQLERPPTIREEVYKYLRQKILTGEAPPGARLVESKLAEEISTSRTPVREALHNLEMEKLIESIPRVGYVVRRISFDEIREICEIRLALESLATRWAAERITAAQLTRLAKIVEATEKAIQRNHTQAVIELSTEFHDIICQASGSLRLNLMSQTLRDHMLRFRMSGLCDADVAERSNQGHRMIVAAIISKDAKEIEAAVRFHLGRTMEDLKEKIV